MNPIQIKTAVFYHFYPHYRKGVLERLAVEFASNIHFFGGQRGAEGIKEYRFANTSVFHPIATYRIGKFVVQPGAIHACLRGGYDCYVFLADPNHLSTWVAAAICRLRRRRVIFWGHGFKDADNSMKNRVRKLFFSLANGFYTYGYRAKVAAVKMGFVAEDIYVGFNSLDYSRQLVVRSKCAALDTVHEEGAPLSIVCISRLTAACKYEMLFEAISLAKARGFLPPSLVIIGDGEEKVALTESARRWGVQAEFVGAIYDETEIAAKLFRADVTVSPGKVGLTAMHSLMYGTPVISNDDFVHQMPEVEALVPGHTGEFFTSGNVADLAETLFNFKLRYPDRELTRRRCYQMVDMIYNPARQVEVFARAVRGLPASHGDDASRLFMKELNE